MAPPTPQQKKKAQKLPVDPSPAPSTSGVSSATRHRAPKNVAKNSSDALASNEEDKNGETARNEALHEAARIRNIQSEIRTVKEQALQPQRGMEQSLKALAKKREGMLEKAEDSAKRVDDVWSIAVNEIKRSLNTAATKANEEFTLQEKIQAKHTSNLLEEKVLREEMKRKAEEYAIHVKTLEYDMGGTAASDTPDPDEELDKFLKDRRRRPSLPDGSLLFWRNVQKWAPLLGFFLEILCNQLCFGKADCPTDLTQWKESPGNTGVRYMLKEYLLPLLLKYEKEIFTLEPLLSKTHWAEFLAAIESDKGTTFLRHFSDKEIGETAILYKEGQGETPGTIRAFYYQIYVPVLKIVDMIKGTIRSDTEAAVENTPQSHLIAFGMNRESMFQLLMDAVTKKLEEVALQIDPKTFGNVVALEVSGTQTGAVSVGTQEQPSAGSSNSSLDTVQPPVDSPRIQDTTVAAAGNLATDGTTDDINSTISATNGNAHDTDSALNGPSDQEPRLAVGTPQRPVAKSVNTPAKKPNKAWCLVGTPASSQSPSISNQRTLRKKGAGIVE